MEYSFADSDKDIRRYVKHRADSLGVRLADSALAVHHIGDVAA